MNSAGALLFRCGLWRRSVNFLSKWGRSGGVARWRSRKVAAESQGGGVARRRSRKAAESQGGGRNGSRTKTPTNFIKATKTIHCRNPQKKQRTAHSSGSGTRAQNTIAVSAEPRHRRLLSAREPERQRKESGGASEQKKDSKKGPYTHKQGRRPIARYTRFPERKRWNARARKRKRKTEHPKADGDPTHDHTRPTERARDTQGVGQTYLADRPRRPARARSEIAGSDRAVV